MSAQTVCDLLADEKSDKADAVVLCVPAAYAEEVHSLPFGNPAFTQGLRRPNSWKTSTVFDVLRRYPGPVLIIQAEHDDVIPPAVIEQILASREQQPTRHMILPSPHKVAVWLSDKPEQRDHLAGHIRDLIDAV